MAAYNELIPTASQRLKDSQPELLVNFGAINTLITVDHVTVGWDSVAGGDQGKHKKVTMPEQGADPATAANELAMYTKVGPTSAVAELFLRRESSGSIISLTEAVLGASGYSYLPSGLLIKWGIQAVGTVAQPAEITVTYNAAHPAFATTVYTVFTSVIAAGGAAADNSNHYVTIKTSALASFVATHRKISGSTAYPVAWNFYYVAIGI